jgi:glycosyltransferase involved in cell wall biosynthesis
MPLGAKRIPGHSQLRLMNTNLLFLFPVVFRPEKVNVATRFTRLSPWASGTVFALSNADRDGLELGRFALYTRETPSSGLKRLLRFGQLLLWRAWRLNRKNPPEVIVAYDPLVCGVCGVLLKWLLGAALVVEMNGDHHQIQFSTSSVKRRIMQFAFRLSLSQADAIKVVNTSQERFIRARYPGKQVFRFPDYVAEEFFRSLPRATEPYLLSLGHPFKSKGVPELIEAFLLIADRYPQLELRIMGWCPPSELPSFQALTRNHPRIRFLPAGWIEDAAEQMRGCYALVNASHFEAGARVVFEAMACRRPVVATRTNSSLDYVRDGVTGLLCEIRNPGDLAEKLDRIAGDPALAQRLGQAGYERLCREFTEADYIRHYREMLVRLGVIGTEAAIAAP